MLGICGPCCGLFPVCKWHPVIEEYASALCRSQFLDHDNWYSPDHPQAEGNDFIVSSGENICTNLLQLKLRNGENFISTILRHLWEAPYARKEIASLIFGVYSCWATYVHERFWQEKGFQNSPGPVSYSCNDRQRAVRKIFEGCYSVAKLLFSGEH